MKSFEKPYRDHTLYNLAIRTNPSWNSSFHKKYQMREQIIKITEPNGYREVTELRDGWFYETGCLIFVGKAYLPIFFPKLTSAGHFLI